MDGMNMNVMAQRKLTDHHPKDLDPLYEESYEVVENHPGDC
jgi:hypothetical protein